MTTEKSRTKDLLPNAGTADAAKVTRMPALVLSLFSTFLWGVITVVTMFGKKSTDGNWVYLYVIIFALISYGLFKMRREAAIAYLVVSVVAVISAWGSPKKLTPAIAGVVVAAMAIRGTFLYARIASEKPSELPTSNTR